MSPPCLEGIIFMDDLNVRVIEFIARHNAKLAIDFEKRDGDHESAREVEGVVLSEGKIL